jgi:hypothetical protein
VTPSESSQEMNCRCKSYSSIPTTIEEIKERCASAGRILPTLILLASNPSKWMSVYRCRICGSTWVSEYPFSELHGGGALCLYPIETQAPEEWLQTASSLTVSIRQEDEDRQFYSKLGVEVGPDLCTRTDCSRQRIVGSVMCRRHHFEMIKGRPYLYEDTG